ncbi:MAG TPA: DNA repair protein RecO [Caulobacterales bacterium]|jgi:DNA repair protein RecO (recombination protein O)|nr:DNA repair protein RecO [Caulobacterales bacterium]
MEWSDDAIVLGAKPFGESGAIAELFTREHGRAAAMVHGGISRRTRPTLQAGNMVRVTWKARTSDQLGFFSPLEVSRPYAAHIMEDAVALAGINSAVALLRLGSAERQPYPNLFEALILLIEGLSDAEVWPALYARFELGLLAELGYGLDLSVCALTGTTDDLAFVSPRSGRAASREAGEQFADKLLRLPPFLTNSDKPVEEGDVADALALAGYFLERRLFDPQGQGMPPARVRLIERLGFAGRL